MTSFSLLSGQLLQSQIQNKTILPQHLKGSLGIFYHQEFLGRLYDDWDRVVSGSVPGGSTRIFGLGLIGGQCERQR